MYQDCLGAKRFYTHIVFQTPILTPMDSLVPGFVFALTGVAGIFAHWSGPSIICQADGKAVCFHADGGVGFLAFLVMTDVFFHVRRGCRRKYFRNHLLYIVLLVTI